MGTEWVICGTPSLIASVTQSGISPIVGHQLRTATSQKALAKIRRLNPSKFARAEIDPSVVRWEICSFKF